MENEPIKEQLRIQNKAYEANKCRDSRQDTNETEGFETKDRREFGKNDSLFIDENENDETPTTAVDSLSVMSTLTGKIWSIQAITMWPQQLNDVPYYRWTIFIT